MRHSRDCLTTVARYWCERLKTVDSRETFARLSHDSCEILVRASQDSRETFARVSRDVRANFGQLFYLSLLSLEMVLFMSHICRIVHFKETSLLCV